MPSGRGTLFETPGLPKAVLFGSLMYWISCWVQEEPDPSETSLPSSQTSSVPVSSIASHETLTPGTMLLPVRKLIATGVHGLPADVSTMYSETLTLESRTGRRVAQ